MLQSPQEYQKMSQVEGRLWWYRVLHHQVLKLVSGMPLEASILDVGCGTGGMLEALRASGFSNLSAGDISPYALAECRRKGFEVSELDVLKLTGSPLLSRTYQVIISNDVFYFAPEHERKRILSEMASALAEGGLLILNLPVFDAFSGTHDLSVGLTRRIQPKEFLACLEGLPLEIENRRFWPAFLSPFVWLMRAIQRWKLRNIQGVKPDSDIDLPPRLLNEAFYWICRLELVLSLNIPWASSMLLCLRKKT